VFRDTVRQTGSLEALTSNPFGIQALMMLQAAPEMFTLYP
jgi:hypothetical protein